MFVTNSMRRRRLIAGLAAGAILLTAGCRSAVSESASGKEMPGRIGRSRP